MSKWLSYLYGGDNESIRMVKYPLCYFAIFCFVLRAKYEFLFFLQLGMVLGVGLFLFEVGQTLRLRRDIVIFLLVIISSYAIGLARDNFSVGYYFLPLVVSSLGIALFLLREGVCSMFATSLFYSFCAVILIEHFVFGYSMDQVVDGSSNHVSASIIPLACLYYIAAYVNQKRIKLHVAATAFFICLLAAGGSGIIVSGFLLGAIFLLYIHTVFKLGNKSIAILSVLIAVSAVFFVVYNAQYFIGFFDHELVVKLDVGRMISGDIRYNIWTDYIVRLDPLGVVIGHPLNQSFYGFNNLHSSYFLLHQRVGILSLVVLVIILLALMRYVKFNRLFLVLLMSLLLRAYSDTILFTIGNYNWVLFYLIFYKPKMMVGHEAGGPPGINGCNRGDH